MIDHLEQEIRRGERAQLLLQDEQLQEAFATIRQELTEQWQNSPARDPEGREKLWLTLKMLDRVQLHLQTVLETGQMAKETLAQRLGQRLSRFF